jgi:hypothetical protein
MQVVETSVITAVCETAAKQHGAISHKQLRSAGMSTKAQHTAIATGWLVPVEPAVVVIAGSPDTWHRQLWIGLLPLDERGWVSHEAAARLHGLDRSKEGVVEFTVPRRSRMLTCSAIVHTTGHVGPFDVLTVSGVQCASATRTIIDLARARIPAVRLEAAIDSAVRLGLSAPIVLERRLAELRGSGRWGARRLDQLLVDSGGESMLERRFLGLMREAGLPRPTTQAVQRSDGRHVARVDFLFEPFPVVVEVTGRRGHSLPAERDRDAQRRNELTDLGFRVYEYTWAHVTQRRSWVVSTMRRRLVAAGWMPESVSVT